MVRLACVYGYVGADQLWQYWASIVESDVFAWSPVGPNVEILKHGCVGFPGF